MSPAKRTSLALLLVVLVGAAIIALNFNPAGLVGSQQRKNDGVVRYQMAYHVGVMAYLYGYPLVDMHRQMHNETHRLPGEQQVLAPVNRFYRFGAIVGPHNAGNFRAPNNDTLYYTAWYDVTNEPLIIHTPDTAGRYYTIAVTNQYSEVEHIGRRTTGTEQRYFALVPPHWQGELPADVEVIPVETNRGWLLGRMLVNGEADFEDAMALVDATWLAGLSEFTPGARPPLPAAPAGTVLEPMESLAFFAIMNDVLKTLPPRPSEAALIAQFDEIGVGPNGEFDIQSLDEDTRRGLEQAIVDGAELVQATTARTIPDYNGWMISQDIGRYGFQYMQRASVVKGGYGNLPEESLYPATIFDADGNLMRGDHRYRLHFPAGQLPPVNGFWSLAAYRLTDAQLEENVLARYSIGDRTPGITYGADGSLTLWLQHEQPTDPDANWLPVPEGMFMLVMRLYEPAAAALDNSYLLPRVEKLP